jgi:hypothetical protein
MERQMKQEDRPPNLGWSALRDRRDLPVWDWLEDAAPVHRAISSKLDREFDRHRLAGLDEVYAAAAHDVMARLAEGLALARRTLLDVEKNGRMDEQAAGGWLATPWADGKPWCELVGHGRQYFVGIQSLAAARMESVRDQWIGKLSDPSAFLRGREDQPIDELLDQYTQYATRAIELVWDAWRKDKSIFGSSPQELAGLFKPHVIPFVTVHVGVLVALDERFAASPDPYAHVEQWTRDFNDKLREWDLATLVIKPADNPIALMAVYVLRTRETPQEQRNAAALVVRRFIADRAIRADGYKDDTATLDTVLADVWGDFPTPVVGDALQRFVRRKTRYPEGASWWANKRSLGGLEDRPVVTGGPLIPGSDEHLDALDQQEGFTVPGSDEHVQLLDRASVQKVPSPTFDIETAFAEWLSEDDMPAARIPYSQRGRPRLRSQEGEYGVRDLVNYASARGCQVNADTVREWVKTKILAAVKSPGHPTREGGAIKDVYGAYRFDAAGLRQFGRLVSEKRDREDRARLVGLVQVLHGNKRRRSAESWVKRCEDRGLGLAEIAEEVKGDVPAWQERSSLQNSTPATLCTTALEELIRVREEGREERRKDRRMKKMEGTADG